MSYIEFYADSARGIYIPQYFADTYNADKWSFKGCYPDSLDILKEGPEHEHYWDAWQDILDYAETTDGWKLYQDGDLWVINYQGATDDLNGYCQSQLEYEETHKDAGDSYSHMPAESWSKIDTQDLMRNLTGPAVMRYHREGYIWEDSWVVDPMGLDPEEVADLALDIFSMESGSIYGPYKEGITIAAYPISEIEIQIPGQFQDVLPHIEESCEAYIKGEYAYMTTDAVWYAIVNPQELQDAIKERVESNA